MKSILVLMAIIGMTSFAQATEKKNTARTVAEESSEDGDVNCKNPMSQAEINLCAHEAAGKALTALTNAVYKKCIKLPSVKESEGGSMHSGAVADCEGQAYKLLTLQLKKINMK